LTRIGPREARVSGEEQLPELVAAAPDEASLQLRASDDERHRTVELLGEHAAAGRITLAELEERVGRAYAATTRAELAGLTRDLPALAQPATPPWRKPSRWFVAVVGGSTRRGRQRLSGRLNVVAVIGGDSIDLRDAEIEGSELVVHVFSFIGGPDIYVPDTVEVELSGHAIIGGNDERGSTREPRPGAPRIRIHSVAFMGGTDVWRIPAEAVASA
jgi:hypothetical protein